MWRALTLAIPAVLTASAVAISSAVVARVAPAGLGDVATTASAAVAGMLFGLLYSWIRGIPWHRIAHVVERVQFTITRQLWWAVAGCISLAVIAFY